MKIGTVALVAGALASPASSAIIHVPADEPTIQAGITAAAPGDIVEIACGTYYEHNLRVAKSILIRSETGTFDCVTIDGQFVRRVIDGTNASGPVVLEGITLKNGDDTLLGKFGGGGYFSGSSSLEIRNCRVFGNRARQGGGLYVTTATLLLADSDLQFNAATSGYGYTGLGGALAISGTTATISNCRILANSADTGGGFRIIGGASVVVQGCEFVNNVAINAAGGVLVASATADFSDCVFDHNRSLSGAGGAVSSSGALTLTASTFVKNSAAFQAGGALHLTGTSAVDRCLLAFNNGGGAILCSTAPTVTCSDFCGNSGGDWISCVASELGSNGNISADPRFCDFASGVYLLDASSPCLPGNHPDGVACGRIGSFDEGCSAVAVPPETESESWTRIKATYR